MKTNLIGLAIAASIVTSFSAFAQSYSQPQRPCDPPAPAAWEEPQPPSGVERYVDGDDDRYVDVDSRTVNGQGGRYVDENVRKWVPGRYEQVYVSNCPDTGYGFARCHSGHLENRWIPGYYTTVQQSVWVPARRPLGPYFGLHAHRVQAGQARIGVRFGFH